jgi:hypothetical protein
MMLTPAANVLMMGVITNSTGDDAATDSERGDYGGDH